MFSVSTKQMAQSLHCLRLPALVVQVTLQNKLGLLMPGAILSGSDPLRRNSSFSLPLHTCVCVLKKFNFKIYPLSKLQVNNTVLLTVVTSQYIRVPEIIHFHNQNFVPFCQHHPIPPYLSLWQQQKFSLVMGIERPKKRCELHSLH